jgi:hypothetical protein
MCRTRERKDTERVRVLKIETDCHVKLSRGRVQFGDRLNHHDISTRALKIPVRDDPEINYDAGMVRRSALSLSTIPPAPGQSRIKAVVWTERI